jgi:hypothetical protein
VVPDVPRRRNARDDAVSASAAGDDGAHVVRATGKTPRIARRRGAVRGRCDAAGRDARRDPARDTARARVDAARATRDGVHRGRLQIYARGFANGTRGSGAPRSTEERADDAHLLDGLGANATHAG